MMGMLSTFLSISQKEDSLRLGVNVDDLTDVTIMGC